MKREKNGSEKALTGKNTLPLHLVKFPPAKNVKLSKLS